MKPMSFYRRVFVNGLRAKLLSIGFAIVFSLACYAGMPSPAVAQPNSQPTMLASIFSFSGKRPDNLGVKDGKLASCPSSPNCVSSQSQDKEHSIKPLTYSSSPDAAFDRLKDMIQNTDNAKIVEQGDRYLYAEFTSKIMGFVDDVEFYLDENDGVIHARSASRLGQSDLGVNRKRIESIRSQFNA
jgi:uncharacterized protein (DUF1499 family)